jgi:glutamate dehydrogenase
MSQPSDDQTDRRRQSSIDAICAAAERIDIPMSLDRSGFVRRYYAQVELEELQSEPHALAAAALAHLLFAARRTARTAKVRAFNPTNERDGYTSVHTVVETVTDDMPFLVDSSSMALRSLGHSIHGTTHPVLLVRRAEDGGFVGLAAAEPGDTVTESWIHFDIVRETDPEALRKIETTLQHALQDVRTAVEDWAPMRDRLRAATDELRATPGLPPDLQAESVALLEWLARDHFTLLGYREYELTAGAITDELRSRTGSGLGLLRTDPPDHGAVVRLTGRAHEEAHSSNPLVITKSNERSTVHRPALLDHIGVKVFDAAGQTVLERRFVGLFTSAAYSGSPRVIPVVRLKIRQLMEDSGLEREGHRSKSLLHILDTLPRDDLFHASVDELKTIAYGILTLQERPRVKLFCRRETFGRFYSCLVYLPRDQYTARARRAIEDVLLRGLEGSAIESEVTVSEMALARLAVRIHVAQQQSAEPDLAALQSQLETAVRTWYDRLRELLLLKLPEERALRLLRDYGEHFSAAYQEEIAVERASRDILKVALVNDGDSELELDLVAPNVRNPQRLLLTTFHRGEPIRPYVALPILENLGLRVVSERGYHMDLAAGTIWIQDFEVDSIDGEALDPVTIYARFKQCFALVLRGDAENDGFNRFVVRAGFDWREASLLRAFCKYLLQTRIRYSQTYMQEVLGRYPGYCRALVKKFASMFDVDMTPTARDALRAASDTALRSELDRTANLDDDRILRAYGAVVNALLRTNYYQRDTAGAAKPYLSLKLDPSVLPDLPKPRPHFEVFVYSQRVEGVHLRASPIARGGIRWSDRREDYRTEVLGLMKAQQVKNTVIVPNGAKGGFVCKALPSGDRDAVRREVVACYQTFIRGLLDLTDNIVDQHVQPPERVLRRDPDDTYLVVAADKGTATFSDIANALSAEYGFWLGDAFASGGSAGYDHKKIGITARGAWEAVKRHFRELGLDPRQRDFTVIGIGDMSGDVFGNGMLLSAHIKLVAAFNHQHIFIDPDPDPAASLVERERLFALPRSTWNDYDRNALSAGGGIYDRRSKSIELSAAARARLDLPEGPIAPPDLIRAILRARADLLWSGGIGTYVKASSESHADARDPSNDLVRVDGNELRCRVVAEGGNLSVTQLGRIEYAQHGGRINTDFIDNSGGVDSSDREVNIKILLNDLVRARELPSEARNDLLAEMTDDVVALVLGNNYAQTQALSIMESRAAERLGEHARLIRVLEAQGLLDRNLEYLPSDEQIDERRSKGLGLTRPELAIILSYSKIELMGSLAQTDIPEDPFLAAELEAYFPARLAKRFKPLLASHRLRREIIAMLVGGSMINRMGPFFVLRTEEETGADVAQVARAYAIVREIFGVRTLWRGIEALDYQVAAKAQYDSIFHISRMVRRAVYWLLQNYTAQLDIEPMVQRFHSGVRGALDTLADLASGHSGERLRRDAQRFEAAGLTTSVATEIASLTLMTQILDIVEIAREVRLSVREVGSLYFTLAAELRLDLIREQIENLKVEDRWRSMARASLLEKLGREQRSLLCSALGNHAGNPPAAALAAWLAEHSVEITRMQRAVADMQASGTMDFATLSVALNEIGRLA